jgi:hypothetical protein
MRQDETVPGMPELAVYRDELQADWELAVAGENPYKIAPL